MAELLITLSNGQTRRQPLGPAPQVIGRDPHCDIPVDDPSMSRNHARFTRTPRGYLIEDLGSKNATIVNDQPCVSRLLQHDDRILIGSTPVVFSESESQTHASVVIAEDAPTSHATRYVSRDRRLLLPQRRLELIYELSERLTMVRGQNELLEGAMSICFETLKFERGAIGVRRRDQRGLDWPVVHNLQAPEGELTISRTLLRRALEHGERAIFTADDAAGADPTMSIVQHGIRSALCVPLLHKDQTLGVIYGDRVSSSASYADEDIDFLAGIARQVSIGLINSRLVEERQEMARLERELDLARLIQTGLFPAALPHRDSVRVAALNDPGRHVSGDYYDVIETSDGRLWCLIADVTGEGVAAALLMANLQAAVRVMIEELDCQPAVAGDLPTDRHQPGALLARWNQLIFRNTDASKFITCLLALFDPKTHQLRLATAGHCAPFIQRGSPAAPEELLSGASTFPLGVAEGAEFSTVDFDLGPEPFVFFSYTDGVIEAMNAEDEAFGRDRLIQVLAEFPELNPQALVKQVRKSVVGFVGDAPQSDDITMLAVHIGR